MLYLKEEMRELKFYSQLAGVPLVMFRFDVIFQEASFSTNTTQIIWLDPNSTRWYYTDDFLSQWARPCASNSTDDHRSQQLCNSIFLIVEWSYPFFLFPSNKTKTIQGSVKLQSWTKNENNVISPKYYLQWRFLTKNWNCW